jgi:cysteine desulfurase
MLGFEETIVQRIYLDHNATTPLLPAVIDRMTEELREDFGNPSSVHHFGQQAKAAIDEARTNVANLIGADPSEVLFTSGGTEADNIAVRGAAEALEPTGKRHLVASAIEHEAVLNTLKVLAKRGWRTTLVAVDQTGILSAAMLRDGLADDTALVSVMHANNEIGTIQPIAELARAAHDRGALFHTDAVQSAGKIPVNVKTLGVDMLSMSAHKFYGPKGVGALWIRRGLRVLPLLTGGRQERSRRAGTENVAGIVGFGVAARLARAELSATAAHSEALVERLWGSILARIPGAVRNGPSAGLRLPNTLSVRFPGCAGESLLVLLDLAGIAASLGSACAAGAVEPSHVLLAMGLDREAARSALRLSVGASTTTDDVDRIVEVLPPLVAQIRAQVRGEAAA